ncbi:MAG TPA: SMI1/KNR4 family protein [Allosphingosinicella sp.]|nr:SMI1/KNR4 family protein [Allosphingosinicella sp.]
MEWEPYLEGLPRPDRKTLEALQARMKIELPERYVEDLEAHTGDIPARNVVKIGKGNKIFGPLLCVGADEDDEYYSYSVERGLSAISEWYEDEEFELHTEFWPFGKDLSTGYYCFDNRPRPLARIVFINLEYDPDEEKAVVALAQGYEEFLESLISDQSL